MTAQSTIDEAISRLVKVYSPVCIYLYGDYAWGIPNEESNFELLVVIDSSDKLVLERGYKGFEALLGLPIPSKITVFTKEEFDNYAQDATSTTYEIKNRGKILYARG